MSNGHRHSSTDARNSQRARRVTLAREVVGEDHITRSKTARGAIADPISICPSRMKMYCRRARCPPENCGTRDWRARLKRNVVVLFGWKRKIKIGLAVAFSRR